EIIKYLMENGADPNIGNHSGQTVLMLASEFNNIELVKYLVKHHTQINAVDDDNNTALIIACGYNNYEIAEYLIQQGALTDIINNDSYSALMYACRRNNFRLVKLLVEGFKIEQFNGTESLKIAFENKNIEIIQFLIEHGIDVNILNYTKYQILFSSQLDNDIKIGKFLIESGVDINKKDEHGLTPLMYACESNKLDRV
ncbi:ankyrin, partial [Neocallimastix californiae]